MSDTPAPVIGPTEFGPAQQEAHWYDIGVGATAGINVAVSFWDTLNQGVEAALDFKHEKEEQAADYLLDKYNKSETSAAVDKILPKAEETLDKAKQAATNWLGYASDPEKLASTLETVKWILIAGTVGYGLFLLAPVIRGAR